MGGQSKGRARRARRERDKRARANARAHTVAEEFGPTIEGIGRNFERVARYWNDSQNRGDASDLARQDMRAALDAAIESPQGIGLVEAVTSLRLHYAMLGSIGAVEMLPAALELLALGLAGGTRSPDTHEAENAYEPERVRRNLTEAVEAGCMIAFFDRDPTDKNALIVFQTVQREILMRSGTYQHILLDTLRHLFSDPAVNSDCLAVLGFTGTEAVEVMATVRSQTIQNLEAHTDPISALRNRITGLFAEQQTRADELGPEANGAAANELREILDGVINVGAGAAIDITAVATDTGIPEIRVEAVLDVFTYQPVDLDTALDRFFTGDNPLRTAPLVADGESRRMLVHDAAALPAVREVIETRLKAAHKDAGYHKRRGDVAEDEALDQLKQILPTTAIHRGFEYLVPDPDAAIPQTRPQDYTKLGEGDGLLLVDDVAIIVEVKAGALTAKSRAGAPARLRGQLRDIVTNAAIQANRVSTRIVEDGGLRLRDGTWIDLSNVREIHSIAVSLEDLSGVTTTTAALIDAGLLPPYTVPWTVSVHDLRIICELVDRPSELLFYLRRRTNPDATRKFLAVDELDLFLYALKHGLFVVPDPEKRAAALPFNATASVADKRRFARQRPVIVESQTNPLDAWYAAQADPSSPTAPKPQLNVDSRLLAMVDALAATGEPGWLATAATLLEQDDQWHSYYGRMPKDLARQTRADGRPHRLTTLTEDSSGSLHVLVLATQAKNEVLHPPPIPLDRYLAAKKYQAKALRATMIIYDSTGTNIKQVIYDNTLNDPNPDLEALLPHLRSLDASTVKVPRPGQGNKRSKQKAKRKR